MNAGVRQEIHTDLADQVNLGVNLKMSHVFLKVKIKSLAEESRIIRREERRSSNGLRTELAEHRRYVVRRESRHSLLAYGYLRGRPRSAIERRSHKAGDADFGSVERMVNKYGPARHNMAFDDWWSARGA